MLCFKKWTSSEDEKLKNGIIKHALHWSAIARDPTYNWDRTDVQLKDRFRVLYKNPSWKRVFDNILMENSKEKAIHKYTLHTVIDHDSFSND